MISSRRNIQNGLKYEQFFTGIEIKNTNPILAKNGSVDDTLAFMKKIVKDYSWQTKKIAKQLQANTIYETCKNVWNFVYNNIQYSEDKIGVEQLRTPIKSWRDRKEGVDCDCMSIFIATILENLGIKYIYRITKYNNNSQYQHVYIVALDENNKEIIIDTVLHKFNQEQPYTGKKDYSMKGIPIQLLNGTANNISVSNKIDIIDNEIYELMLIEKKSLELIYKNAKCDAISVLNYLISNWYIKDRNEILRKASILEEKIEKNKFFRALYDYRNNLITINQLKRNTYTSKYNTEKQKFNLNNTNNKLISSLGAVYLEEKIKLDDKCVENSAEVEFMWSPYYLGTQDKPDWDRVSFLTVIIKGNPIDKFNKFNEGKEITIINTDKFDGVYKIDRIDGWEYYKRGLIGEKKYIRAFAINMFNNYYSYLPVNVKLYELPLSDTDKSFLTKTDEWYTALYTWKKLANVLSIKSDNPFETTKTIIPLQFYLQQGIKGNFHFDALKIKIEKAFKQNIIPYFTGGFNPKFSVSATEGITEDIYNKNLKNKSYSEILTFLNGFWKSQSKSPVTYTANVVQHNLGLHTGRFGEANIIIEARTCLKDLTLNRALKSPLRNAFLFLCKVGFTGCEWKAILGTFPYEIAKNYNNISQAEWQEYRNSTMKFYNVWCDKYSGNILDLKEQLFKDMGSKRKAVIQALKTDIKKYNYYRYYDEWAGVPRVGTSLTGTSNLGEPVTIGTAATILACITAASSLIAVILDAFKGDGTKIPKECKDIKGTVDQITQLLSTAESLEGENAQTKLAEYSKKLEEAQAKYSQCMKEHSKDTPTTPTTPTTPKTPTTPTTSPNDNNTKQAGFFSYISENPLQSLGFATLGIFASLFFLKETKKTEIKKENLGKIKKAKIK